MIQYTYDNHSVPQVIDNEFYELVNNNQYIRHFVICHPHSDPMAESNKYYFIQQLQSTNTLHTNNNILIY